MTTDRMALELRQQLGGIQEQGADMRPHRGFQRLAVHVGTPAGGLAGGQHPVLAGTAVVVSYDATGQDPGHAMHGQTTSAAGKQAAQQMVVLLVVPKRWPGVARQLLLSPVPVFLLDDRRD